MKKGEKKQINMSHDRKKKYVLEEGVPVPFLQDLGVMTQDGKIVHAKEDNNIEASIKRCEAALRVSPTLGRLLDGFATESANSEKDHPEKEDKEGV